MADQNHLSSARGPKTSRTALPLKTPTIVGLGGEVSCDAIIVLQVLRLCSTSATAAHRYCTALAQTSLRPWLTQCPFDWA